MAKPIASLLVPTGPVRPPDGRSFMAAPHRMFFFGGVWALVVSMLWWAAVLSPLPVVPAAPRWIHGWLMVFGAFPFFVFGFLFTVMPRWLSTQPVPAALYRRASCALMAGYGLTLIGALWALPLAAAGMGLSIATWMVCALTLARLLVPASDRRQIHPSWAVAAVIAGGLAATAGVYGVITDDPVILFNAPRFGLWAFLGPIVFVVAHRMLPFFASAALGSEYRMVRPRWSPAAVVCLLWAHAVLMLAGLNAWLLVTDLPLLAITGWHLWRWRPWQTRRIPLLWTLFAAFAWLPVALALSLWQSIAMLAFNAPVLGQAPLHALGAGLAASMVFAMVTRVSMGHSGRPLRMERHAIICFLVLQLAAVARIAAALPVLAGGRGFWLLLAAVLWLIALTPWALRLSAIYWRPRIDGRPG